MNQFKNKNKKAYLKISLKLATQVSKQTKNFKNKIHHHSHDEKTHKEQVFSLTTESVLYNSASLAPRLAFSHLFAYRSANSYWLIY